jgi:hypothetical protein
MGPHEVGKWGRKSGVPGYPPFLMSLNLCDSGSRCSKEKMGKRKKDKPQRLEDLKGASAFASSAWLAFGQHLCAGRTGKRMTPEHQPVRVAMLSRAARAKTLHRAALRPCRGGKSACLPFIRKSFLRGLGGLGGSLLPPVSESQHLILLRLRKRLLYAIVARQDLVNSLKRLAGYRAGLDKTTMAQKVAPITSGAM